jgi:hypothetical protein
MKRLNPLSVAAALVVSALVAALVAAGTGGASAAGKTKAAGTFRQALAAKLGEQLHKPTADVLAAMKAAHRARLGTTSKADRRARRAARLRARAQRIAAGGRARANGAGHRRAERAEKAAKARAAWAAALATPLNVSPGDVTAALRALVAERLAGLVSEGWIAAGRRDAELACFDDATKCQGVRPPGLALLRAGR